MTLDYKTPTPPTTTTHDHIYTTLLGVLGFLMITAIVTLAMIRMMPTIPAESRTILLMPLATEGLFLAAIVLVLFIRLVFPAYRRWPTMGLNIILLLFVPFGTALAIYGFLKVDKNLPRTPN